MQPHTHPHPISHKASPSPPNPTPHPHIILTCLEKFLKNLLERPTGAEEGTMAGKALRKKLLAEIDTRGGPEWLQDYIAEGGKISDLATELGCSRSYLSRHLNAHPDYKAVIVEARSEYADKLADEALDIADGMAEIGNITREQVAVAKERIDVRKWLASVNDPSRFRQNNGGPTVNININQLHLEALKKHRDGGITIEGSVVDGE